MASEEAAADATIWCYLLLLFLLLREMQRMANVTVFLLNLISSNDLGPLGSKLAKKAHRILVTH